MEKNQEQLKKAMWDTWNEIEKQVTPGVFGLIINLVRLELAVKKNESDTKKNKG